MVLRSSVPINDGNNGETRIRAIGVAGNLTLHCVYTQRGEVRRIISLRYANRKERDAYRATYPG
jgi:uncharacterized DUF497 family protein